MAKQFVSFLRLTLYDKLIKEFIKAAIDNSDSQITDLKSLLDVLNGDGEGSVSKQIKDAFDEFITTDGAADALDSYKEVVEYVNKHGKEFADLVATYNELAAEIGKEATEDSLATGIYAKIEDVKNSEIFTTDGEDIKVTLSGTVSNPKLEVLYDFCTESDIARLFIPAIEVTSYDDFVNAISEAVPGQTIKIQSPIVQQVTIPEGKEVVLDLNGQTISSTGSAIINNGILTISDESLGRSNGAIISTKNCGIAAGNNSVTTILSGTISGTEGAVITGKASGAVINIEGGNFSASDNAVIAGNGTNRTGEPNVINISGGRFESNIQSPGYIACGVYAPWKDTINITGGEFIANNGCGVLARAGQVNITGGTFTTTGNGTGWVGDNKNQIPCAAVVFDSKANYPGLDDASKITISGGTFNSEVEPIQTLGDSSRIIKEL